MKKIKTIGISLLVAACATCLSLAFVACKGGEKSASYGSGEEGFYYYDASDSTRYMLSLQSGTYMITANGDAAYSGEYSYDEEKSEISFTGDEKFTAAVGENALSLDMGDSGYSFKAYKYFDVTYVDESGNTVAVESVLNGQSAEALEIEKDGYWFIGWYGDSANSSEFSFVTQIAGDTTVYGWYIEKNPTATEYEITLDYGDGTTGTVSTMNGAVWTLPTDGILGWWVSATNKSGELTYKYNTGDVFTADTTLFAVYSGMGASVTSAGITWENATGSNVYVTIYDENGDVLSDFNRANVSSSTPIYAPTAFTSLATGTYTIELESGTTTETLTYIVNGLARVSTSSAEVITNGNGEVFSFAPVDGAAGYVITVSDGTRTLTEDLGPRTYYNFSGWDMTKEGITFTVTAYAEGYVSSVSDEYCYLLVLDKVTVDVDGEDVVWTRAENALEYEVIIYGEDGNVLDTVRTSDNSYSLKYYDAGTYTISVQPVTDGYWSEASTYYGYAKSTIAAPVITDITSYSVTWGAVTGATSYVVSVNGTEYKVEEGTTLVFTDTSMPATADIYEISVKAVGTNGNDSSYSDAITATNGGFTSGATYYKNTVTWNYDLAAARYEISVNGDKTYTVTSGNSQEIKLTKAGTNDIVVTAYDADGEAVGYAEISVYAYSVTLDGNGAKTSKSVVYVAQGDTLDLGTASLDHADFIGWYTQADYTMGQSDVYEGTGTEVLDGSTFTGNRSTYLYAYYSYEWIDVTLVSTMGYMDDGNGNEVESVTVKIKYKSTSFTLPSVSPYNEEDNFDGWNTKSNGNGTKYTTSAGESNGTAFAGETTLYAFFRSVLFYERTTYGGQTVYSVSAGSEINYETDVKIPESYKGYDLILNANAFQSCVTLETISIPDTILYIACTGDGYSSGSGAFVGCTALTAVNIYATGDNPEPVYFSADGVLFDKINENGDVEVLYYPYGRKIEANETAGTVAGEYTLPSVVYNDEEEDYQGNAVAHAVTTISARVFRYRQISVINIPSSVTSIASYAFYGNTYLTKVNFIEDTRGTALTIENYAFYQCTKLEDVTIPSWYGNFNVAAFDGCKSLQNIYVTGSSYYTTQSGVLLDSTGTTLVYYPQGRSGDVSISQIATTITAIGANAFGGNTKITSVTIPTTVTTIKTSAFEDCAGILSLTFEGSSNSQYGALTIEKRAFYGCLRLKEVILPARLTNLGENAFGGCTNLSYVYFDAASGATADSLQFADGAFGTTNNITTLELGANVPLMDFASVFDGGHITQIIISTDNPNYYSDEYGVVFDKDVTEILYYPLARIGDYTVPDTVSGIDDGTFVNRTGLYNLTIGAGVNTIADGAFDGCTYLKAIYIDEGNSNYGNGTLSSGYKDGILYKREEGQIVELIFCPVASEVTELDVAATVVKVDEKAFYGNATIESVAFNAAASFEFASSQETISNVAYYTSYTFYQCTALTTVVLPDCMTFIPGYAFRECSALETINIPASVTEIGAYAFYKCTKLTGDLTRADEEDTSGIELPEGLKKIDTYAFYSISGLAVTIPSTVEDIEGYAFNGCWGVEAPIVFAKAETGTTKVSLTIGNYAFGSGKYVTKLEVPARVISLGTGAFSNYDASIPGGAELSFEEGFSLEELPASLFTGSSMTSFEIPASVKKVGSTQFGNTTGGSNNTLTSITFAEGSQVEEFDTYAFYNCQAITEFTIPASVKTIGNYAFQGCSALQKITFESGEDGTALTSIGQSAFQNTLLANSDYPDGYTLEIPVSVTSVGAQAFYGCSGLTSISFQSGGETSALTSIGYACFRNCTALTSVDLPANLLTIENGSTNKADYGLFNGCTALKEVTIPGSVTSLTAYAFTGCTALETVKFGADGSTSSLTTVGTYAFNNCSALANVELPSTVTSIADYAFYGCASLASLTIPNSVTSIGAGMFSGCSSLATISIPAGVTSIGASAFNGCSSLSSVTFETDTAGKCSLTSIGAGAFDGCTSLTSFAFPESTSDITLGDELFSDSGVREITLSSSITAIGNAFLGATFDKMTVVSENKYYMTDDDDNPILYDTQKKTIECVYGLLTDTEITIPDGITSIGASAFSGQTNIEKVILPEGVTTLGEHAFEGCTALKYIELPSTLTSLPAYCFGMCDLSGVTADTFRYIESMGSYALAETNMTETAFESLVELGQGALSETALVKVTFGSALATMGTYAFAASASLEEVVFSDGCPLVTIPGYAFQNCSSLKAVNIPSKVTSIATYAFSYCSSLVSVDMPSGITSIGTYAFEYTSSLESVVLPDGITTISNYTFQYSGLVECSLPANLETIGQYAFRYCYSLSSISFPDDLEEIQSSAFYQCTSLQSIDFNDNLTTLGQSCFYGCTALETLYIGKSVTSVAGQAFRGCTSLVYAYTGDSLTQISDTKAQAQYYGMFYGCSKLKEVEFGPYVTTIGYYAFYNCTSLESIVIPKGVTTIGGYAFRGCTKLKEVVIPSTVSSMSTSAPAFYSCSCTIYFENTPNYVAGWGSVSSWAGSNYTGTVYYYSAIEPTFNETGTGYDENYWYYDDDNEICIWEFGYETYATEDGGYVLFDADGQTVAYVCMLNANGVLVVYEVVECTPVYGTVVKDDSDEDIEDNEDENDGAEAEPETYIEYYVVTLENGETYKVELSTEDGVNTATVVQYEAEDKDN